MKQFDVNNIQLQIQSPGIDIDDKLSNHLISHVEKLGKMLPRMKKCEIILNKEKESHNRNCVAEAKIFVPGNLFFSKEQEENFMTAIDKVFEDLYKQVYRIKSKRLRKRRLSVIE